MIRTLLALALAIALQGCVSVLPEARPAAPRYLIDAVSYEERGEPVAWSLSVEDPIATRVYDTSKIALIRERGRLEYLANGEWADRAPRLVQAALVRSFENSGRILGVGDRASLPTSDFILQTDIRALHVDYVDGSPQAVFSIYARLTNVRGKVYAAGLFERRASAGQGAPANIASAFDDVVTNTLREIVDWSFSEGASAQAK